MELIWKCLQSKYDFDHYHYYYSYVSNPPLYDKVIIVLNKFNKYYATRSLKEILVLVSLPDCLPQKKFHPVSLVSTEIAGHTLL